MGSPYPMHLLLFCLLLSLAQTLAVKKSYIVYLGSHAHGAQVSEAELDAATRDHEEFLGSFLGSNEKAKDAMTNSYQRHINGFSAILEEEVAAEIAKHPKVASVFLNRVKKLHTIHSWEFMFLEKRGHPLPYSIWEKARYGQDVIVATMDTGVWPESKSFGDEGMGPVPQRWRGSCQNNTKKGVPCNRKLIGARYFNKGYASLIQKIPEWMNTARDNEGHGTHTLSTAGGGFVPGASISGFVRGTVKGGSPWARVAAYKVCWPPVPFLGECMESDIVEGFDHAIEDGVDVLSVSLGGMPMNYYEDGTAIASFHAVQKGIPVVCSAGNDGPTEGTVTNNAPWIITVAASTLDRRFEANVVLQNGAVLKGTSLSAPLPSVRNYPLVTGALARVSNVTELEGKLCLEGSLDPKKVNGTILACMRGNTSRIEKGYQAAKAGAAGVIIYNDETNGEDIIADSHLLPASHIGYEESLVLLGYMNSTCKPEGYIIPPMAKYGERPSPSMASFSSAGPNMATPEILKPDITAPGVDIIAAFSEAVSPTGLAIDNRTFPFNVLSGTSMSCPHVSGVVGLLKSIHPDWSPAAIKSAIMTTALVRDNTRHAIVDASRQVATPFRYGAGHINPNVAADPGLVYDLGTVDYLNFLCAIGYNETTVRLFSGTPFTCPESFDLRHFNYPSMVVRHLNSTRYTMTRTLKNVGWPGIYTARIIRPRGVSVTVRPKWLKFNRVGSERKFRITFRANRDFAPVVDEFGNTKWEDRFGRLTWSDGRHFVGSPIVILMSV